MCCSYNWTFDVHWIVEPSCPITTVLCTILSLQVLLSAVGDLLNTLVESENTSLLGVYIGSVMPTDSEWEKMRRSLPIQVCLTSQSAFLILKFLFHACISVFFWRIKNS